MGKGYTFGRYLPNYYCQTVGTQVLVYCMHIHNFSLYVFLASVILFFELKTVGEALTVNFIKKKTYLQKEGEGNVQKGIAQGKAREDYRASSQAVRGETKLSFIL
jgi:hypothetical protein